MVDGCTESLMILIRTVYSIVHYLYICFMTLTRGAIVECNLRRRKRENIVAHIREQHSAEDGAPSTTAVNIQRLAVRRRPLVQCDMCTAEVGSHTQLIQHKIR